MILPLLNENSEIIWWLIYNFVLNQQCLDLELYLGVREAIFECSVFSATAVASIRVSRGGQRGHAPQKILVNSHFGLWGALFQTK